MSIPQNSSMEPLLLSSHSPLPYSPGDSLVTVSTISSTSNIQQNIQFFIEMAKGLPEPANIRNKRIVRASCSSKNSKGKNYRTSASTSHFWSDNTSQIGPVSGSDKVTFSIELHTPLRMVKRFVNTVASSEPYTINSLLEMQGKAGNQNISIPLRLNNKRENQTKNQDDSLLDASLLLRVKQPTATFISEQLQEEANRSFTEREEKERLSISSSTQTLPSEPLATLPLEPGHMIREFPE